MEAASGPRVLCAKATRAAGAVQGAPFVAIPIVRADRPWQRMRSSGSGGAVPRAIAKVCITRGAGSSYGSSAHDAQNGIRADRPPPLGDSITALTSAQKLATVTAADTTMRAVATSSTGPWLTPWPVPRPALRSSAVLLTI